MQSGNTPKRNGFTIGEERLFHSIALQSNPKIAMFLFRVAKATNLISSALKTRNLGEEKRV